MKITIDTDHGPRETTGYETCVHGLVVNRAYNARPRGWVVTHLGTGAGFPALFRTLADARRVVRQTEALSRAAGVSVGWGYRAVADPFVATGLRRTWWITFKHLAVRSGARPIGGPYHADSGPNSSALPGGSPGSASTPSQAGDAQ